MTNNNFMTKEELAKKAHDLYEYKAKLYNYTTRLDTRDFDPESPNGKLMIDVFDSILNEIKIEIESCFYEMRDYKANKEISEDYAIGYGNSIIDMRENLIKKNLL